MQTRKIVINNCFGGFGLSGAAQDLYAERKGLAQEDFSVYEIERDDEVLVSVVEELGQEANGRHSRLKVVEIPADVDWYISEYDGAEHIAEKHRTWG